MPRRGSPLDQVVLGIVRRVCLANVGNGPTIPEIMKEINEARERGAEDVGLSGQSVGSGTIKGALERLQNDGYLFLPEEEGKKRRVPGRIILVGARIEVNGEAVRATIGESGEMILVQEVDYGNSTGKVHHKSWGE